jgi:hypothetical protein
MVADTHHHRLAADETINFDALYPRPDQQGPDGQLPGQLSIDDIPNSETPLDVRDEATG